MVCFSTTVRFTFELTTMFMAPLVLRIVTAFAPNVAMAVNWAILLGVPFFGSRRLFTIFMIFKASLLAAVASALTVFTVPVILTGPAFLFKRTTVGTTFALLFRAVLALVALATIGLAIVGHLC